MAAAKTREMQMCFHYSARSSWHQAALPSRSFCHSAPSFCVTGVCVCVYMRLHTRRVTGRSCLLPPAPWLQPHGCLQEPAEFTPYTEHTWVSVSRQVQNGAWHWGGTAGWCPVPPQQQAGSSHTSALSSSQALRFVAGPHQTSPRFFHP